MPSDRFLEQEDHDMQWLAREAPQFHTLVEPPSNAPSYPLLDKCDDASSSSGSDSAGSDSEDDPYAPYNFHNPSQKWVRDGDFVYAADDLHDSYLAEDRHVNGDMPYVPSDQERDKEPPLFLSPADLATTSPCDEPYIYRDPAPQDQSQTLSPLGLTSSLPSASHTATHAHEYSRIRRTIASPRQAARRTAHDLSHVYSSESDDEGDTSSGDDGSEDEYVPSPPIRPRKLPTSTRAPSQGKVKSRATPRLSYSPYPSSSTSTCAGESSSSINSRRPGSRNIQIIDQPPPPRGSWPKTGPDAYKCPYCDHIQKNKRSPDMERHIRSHFRRKGQSQWVCCGLPLEEAMRHGRGPGDNPWKFNGVLMVGGCHEDFSRMDALKRHWRNGNNSCIGDVRYARVKDEPSH
ncbi:hypothetical protein BD414DRAFT_428165 [Trametes punicea]|nr:hypothetical protein BD414DRAFT_428165 [Trametes punicea]